MVIALQRYGQTVIAVDAYEGAPAMQMADGCEVINMLDGEALDAVVAKHQPDIIVPEVESIRTERFYDYEERSIHVVPSARAANITMNARPSAIWRRRSWKTAPSPPRRLASRRVWRPSACRVL